MDASFSGFMNVRMSVCQSATSSFRFAGKFFTLDAIVYFGFVPVFIICENTGLFKIRTPVYRLTYLDTTIMSTDNLFFLWKIRLLKKDFLQNPMGLCLNSGYIYS